MIQFTPKVHDAIRLFLEGENSEQKIFRITITGADKQGFKYRFLVDDRSKIRDEDVMVDAGGFKVAIDSETALNLKGATIDYGMTTAGPDFIVNNPNKPAIPEAPAGAWPRIDLNDPTTKKVQEIIERDINPSVASHGGFVDLVAVENNKVFLTLGGGCHGCGMSQVTLRQGIEVLIKEAVPQITEVVDVTDHASGINPFYAR